MLFTKIIAVLSDNHTKLINLKKAALLIVKACGTYSYRLTLKG
jgi:hypothetical protein